MKKAKLPVLLALFGFFGLQNLSAQDYNKIIKDYISINRLKDFKKNDLADFRIDNVDPSTSLKGTVVKIQQVYKGYPVLNTDGVALIKNDQISYFNDGFVLNYDFSSSNVPAISNTVSAKKIADSFGIADISNLPIIDFYHPNGTDNVMLHRLVYVNESNTLTLAHQMMFPEPKSSNYWNVLVNAETGEIFHKENMTLSCNFEHNAYSLEHTNHVALSNIKMQPNFEEKKVENKFSALLPPDPATYNVFQFPVEAPTFGSRSIATNPWNLTASPQGWHSDGTNSYTYTRGNNVYVYEDAIAVNTPGLSADGGATRNFDFPYSINADASTNFFSALTNLFYVNNKVHDVLYSFGFTESAKNYQKNNFSKGGLGNDPVNAEAQDGGGTNNANFQPTADGTSGRMQMYLWDPKSRFFFYNAPSDAVSRTPTSFLAEFGSPLDAVGVTGNVQLSSVLDGCTALPVGSMTGKIGLVERGNCNFTEKVKNIQVAGGIAAIVYNAASSTTIGPMGGTDATVTIPSVLIYNSEGEFIKSKLAANTVVNVTLKNDPNTSIYPDGSFDNGIIAHEYGHGVSNRLTGTGSGCMSTSSSREQMGEGWSDFFAIMLTNQPGATAAVSRGIGTYATGQQTTGSGIRPRRYSPDFTINDFTYGDTNGMEYTSGTTLVTDVHSIGFVWATMLWDLHWKFVELYGYASDVTANPASGSAKVLQLVMDGMKLQACNPTFIDGRNAIIQADQNINAGANKCTIWRTFAKRGLGVNASAGTKTSINDQVEDFTVPTECQLSTSEVQGEKSMGIYPNPAKNEFYLDLPKNTLGKVRMEVYDASGKLVMSEDKISPNAKRAFSTDKLTNGVYVVKVKGLGLETSSKLIVRK